MSDEKEESHDYICSPRVIDPLCKESTPLVIENGTRITLGNKEFTLSQKLGQGGFGSVYKCFDNEKKQYAIKKISSDSIGTPCLFEAAIMSTLNHPCLNKSLMIESNPKGLYILQNVAEYDLSSYINQHTRNGSFIQIPQLRNILYRVGKGLAYLHGKGMIHGDIKSHNILYYSDDDIRISDFNLTTMIKWQPTKLHLCTSMYRPLEIWLNKSWNDKLDIWCFGCVMYELIYGKLLIPWQGDNKADRSLNKKKYINCLIDWSNFNSYGKTALRKYNVTYNEPNISKELVNYKNNVVRDIDDRDRDLYINLMLRCLQSTSSSRPSIDTILSDNLFACIRHKSEYSNLNIIYENIEIGISKDFYSIIEKEMVPYVGKNDKELLRLSSTICYRYTHINKYTDNLMKRVCVWIAKKLLRTTPLSQEIPDLKAEMKEKFLQTELHICNTLQFKLI